MNFYKHFIGDYQRDTGHLSLVEHGAYRLMLDTFYATQKPLPKDRRALYRLLRAESATERRAIDSVVSQFWSAGEKGLVNLRAETEIGKAQKQAEVNRQIAITREEKRRMAKRIAGDEGQLFSGVSGCKHGSLGHPENQVYGVCRADGSSMPDEKQAINGVNVVKNTNKDAFMAMSGAKTAFPAAVNRAEEAPADMPQGAAGMAQGCVDAVADRSGGGAEKAAMAHAGVTESLTPCTIRSTKGEPSHSHNHNQSHIRKIEAERAVPDGNARVEIRIEQLAGELEKRRALAETHETRHGMAYFYPPGTIVATPSGRQAVVLRYLHGTGKADTFERAICRYLDSPSERECVTLQPRFLRRIS